MLIFKSFIKLQHFILIMISSASLPPNSSDYSPLNTHPSLFSINYLLSIIYSLFICQWVGVVINIGDFGHIYLGIQLRCGQ